MVPALKRKAEVILDPEVEKAKEEEKKEDLVNPMDLDHIFGEFTAEQTRTLKCLADFIQQHQQQEHEILLQENNKLQQEVEKLKKEVEKNQTKMNELIKLMVADSPSDTDCSSGALSPIRATSLSPLHSCNKYFSRSTVTRDWPESTLEGHVGRTCWTRCRVQ